MSKRQLEQNDQSGVEKHDSAFLSPLILFKSYPHNETFVDVRDVKITAIPEDELADTYTFTYRGNEYGIIKSSEAILVCDLQLMKVADATVIDDNAAITMNALPMRTMFKSKEIYVNDTSVNNVTNNDHIISWIRHIATEIPINYLDSKKINLAIHDTPGNFDSQVGLGDGLQVVNAGARERQRLFNHGAVVHVIDTLDAMCFNENGADRYIPSDFDIKLVLHRNNKNKILFGTNALGTATNVHVRNLQLKFRMFKPKQQLANAINHLMIQKDEECIFYSTHYRLVARPVAQGTQIIQENDIFSGSRPTRLYTGLITQARHNGSYELNPFLFAFPALQYFAVRINNAIVPPEIRRSQEAYEEFKKVLNRQNQQMPFSYDAYVSSYGIIAMDLTENKDSFNEVLPNATNGIISVEMNLSAALGAAHQILFIGEFRNELKVGYKTPARKKYDF